MRHLLLLLVISSSLHLHALERTYSGFVKPGRPMCTTQEYLRDWYMLKQKGDLKAPAFLLEECFVAHGQKLRVMIVGPKQPGTVTTEPPCKPWVVVYQGAKYWACAKAVEREK